MTEAAVVYSGIAARSRRRVRHRGIILAYHNIVPRGEQPQGDLPLHLPQDQFAAHLDLLAEHCEVVPLESLLDQPGGDYPRPRVAITFDDAYRGALTVGLAELTLRRLPATMFVAPGFLGGRSFWWDAIGAAEGSLPERFRVAALEQADGKDEQVRRLASESGIRANEPPSAARCADLAELELAAGYSGLSFGSHSWSHPNLARIPPEEYEAELGRPLGWLRDRLPRVLPALAYPYGLSSARLRSALPGHGYVAALAVTGGWLPDGAAASFELPRLNVPSGLSPYGLLLRVSGLFAA